MDILSENERRSKQRIWQIWGPVRWIGSSSLGYNAKVDALIEAALAYVPRNTPFRALVMPAGDGVRLVELATAMSTEARYAALDDDTRRLAVMTRLRGADSHDLGAQARVGEWAGLQQSAVSLGDLLAFDDQPVQGQLFGPTVVRRPPAAFAEAPFDLVIADVPRGDLSATERDHIRRGYDALRGQFTVEVPMIERAVALIAPGGLLALRVRKAILRREFARTLVRELGQTMQLLTIDEDGPEHVVAVLRAAGAGDGAVLLRVFGSERAARVLRAMEQSARTTLAESVDTPLGATSNPGCDEVWQAPSWLESRLPTMPLLRGADIHPWRISPAKILWPYDDEGQRRTPQDEGLVAFLSRFRSLLEQREVFGRTLQQRDVRWFEYLEHHPERWGRTPAVVIARTGIKPRVGLVRAPTVVTGSALIINPRPEVDPYFIAGLLGSSLGGFWMKQVFHVYETGEGTAFEITSSGLNDFPVPEFSPDVASAARALERVARSLRPLSAVIDGEPDRLGPRLDATIEANREILAQCTRLNAELDRAVCAAYGIDPDIVEEPPTEFEWEENERDALFDWLIEAVSGGFEAGQLPQHRPISDSEVADWLRTRPLCRAVLTRLNASAVDVLVRGSVPLEPELVFSPTGLEKLRAWASGEPAAFHRSDYAAKLLQMPVVSASALRETIWRWRGRFNVPREPFVLLATLSRERGRPTFAWAGSAQDSDAWSEVAAEPSAQVDLELLLRLRALVHERPRPEGQLADVLFAEGWSSVDVQLGLHALEHAGTLALRGGTWRPK